MYKNVFIYQYIYLSIYLMEMNYLKGNRIINKMILRYHYRLGLDTVYFNDKYLLLDDLCSLLEGYIFKRTQNQTYI